MTEPHVEPEAAVDTVRSAVLASDAGLVELNASDDELGVAAGLAEAAQVAGRPLRTLWGLDRSWVAWRWDDDDSKHRRLVGFHVHGFDPAPGPE